MTLLYPLLHVQAPTLVAKNTAYFSCIYKNSLCSCPALLPAGPTSSCQLAQLAVLQVLLCVSPAVSPPKHPTSLPPLLQTAAQLLLASAQLHGAADVDQPQEA